MPSPELTAAIYPWLLPAHIGLVSTSVALFTARGLGVLAGQGWPMADWARGLAPVVDSLLLLAGGSLWWLLQLNPLQNHWLPLKPMLLPGFFLGGPPAPPPAGPPPAPPPGARRVVPAGGGPGGGPPASPPPQNPGAASA